MLVSWLHFFGILLFLCPCLRQRWLALVVLDASGQSSPAAAPRHAMPFKIHSTRFQRKLEQNLLLASLPLGNARSLAASDKTWPWPQTFKYNQYLRSASRRSSMSASIGKGTGKRLHPAPRSATQRSENLYRYFVDVQFFSASSLRQGTNRPGCILL